VGDRASLVRNEQQGEKERARETEERVRNSEWLERIMASLINLAIDWSSMRQNIINR
jgi:hypothetical protein